MSRLLLIPSRPPASFLVAGRDTGEPIIVPENSNTLPSIAAVYGPEDITQAGTWRLVLTVRYYDAEIAS